MREMVPIKEWFRNRWEVSFTLEKGRVSYPPGKPPVGSAANSMPRVDVIRLSVAN